jgi:hypothetical protein
MKSKVIKTFQRKYWKYLCNLANYKGFLKSQSINGQRILVNLTKLEEHSTRYYYQSIKTSPQNK